MTACARRQCWSPLTCEKTQRGENARKKEKPMKHIVKIIALLTLALALLLAQAGCAESDAGRIIGRRGRTIKAIRTLARALGQRVGTSVEVEILG